jgi:3-hydroxyisobutyrate dehydrogenase
LQRLRGALDAVAKNVFHVGDAAGQGQAMKLLNNFLSGTALAATSEAVAYGETQELDPRTVIDVLNASTGRNTATSDKFPNRILTGSFDAGFQTALMAKDLRLYVESARTGGAYLDIGERVAETWRRVAGEMPDSDCTRIYEFVRGPRRA